jgi:hypothetical protein
MMVSQCQQDITRLQSRIVKNPEELKQLLLDMAASLQQLKQTVMSNERASRDLQIKLENLNLVEQVRSSQLLCIYSLAGTASVHATD